MTENETKRTPGSSIRLTPAFFHILLAVANESRHGYAIMQEVQERTRGRVKLGPGSLYWAIKRLVDSTELYFVPCVNPDGVNLVWTKDRWWRKNGRGSYGVDLNRNWCVVGFGVGATEDQSKDTYKARQCFHLEKDSFGNK